MVVVLFHSMFGLRAVECAAAERLRAAGCRVVVPDLFGGATVPGEIKAGFALMEQIGWPTIVGRARHALNDVPDDAVLGGFSMGVGVIGALWPERLGAAGVFCLHAPTTVPQGVPAGTAVQLHVALNDRFAPAEQIAAFQASAVRASASASLHQYSDAGHFFTDETLRDYNAEATTSTWARVTELITAVQ